MASSKGLSDNTDAVEGFIDAALARISDYYGVPAKRGGRVVLMAGFHDQAGKIGVIEGVDDMRLILRVDDRRAIYHPTWELRYLDD